MSRISKNHSSLALIAAACVVATPLAAQTLATDLWAEWQAQAAFAEQNLSAEAVPTDTGLRLLNMTSVVADTGFSATSVVEEVTMTENADGSVSVTFSEPYLVTFTFEVDPGDPPGNIELVVEHENFVLQIAGDPGSRVYTYSADEMTMRQGEISGGGGMPPDIDIDMILTDFDATYRLFGTDPAEMRFASTYSLGTGVLLLEINGPDDDPGRVKAGLIYNEVSGSGAGSIVSPSTFADPTQPPNLPENFEVGGQGSHRGFDLEMSVDIPDLQFDFVGGTDTGDATFTFSTNAVVFESETTGMNLAFATPFLPTTIEAEAASIGMVMDIPLSAGDEPQDTALRLALQEVSLSEGIWGLFDPTQSIPRDPATAILDATVQLQLFVDLLGLNPETLTAPPGELRGLTVNELQVSAGGADLTGTADLSFAPGQIEPVPEGSADLQLSGGNGLLDALIGAGLVPAEQGAFVRGMANVFARPGAAPDTLETTVQFGADGSVTANGIPLQ